MISFERKIGQKIMVGVSMDLSHKESKALSMLRGLGSVAVAYSGGVDSTFVCSLAREALGDRAVAILGLSPFNPDDLIDAREFAEKIDIRLYEVNLSHMTDDRLISNPPERCYYCKMLLFGAMSDLIGQLGIGCMVDGSTMDDLSDTRPGMRAAREIGVRSPLIEAGITKAEVRELSRIRDIPTWDKPQMACLASRIPYGTRITEELLGCVGEAERYLRTLGFSQLRVRAHDRIARIEIGQSDFQKALEMREKIIGELKRLGFVYITLDLAGFRSGSMNEVL